MGKSPKKKKSEDIEKPVRFEIPLDATREQLQKFIDDLKQAVREGKVKPDPRSKWYPGPKKED